MRVLLRVVLLIFIVSCNKNKPLPPKVPDAYENGVLILNEGLFEQNNASLTFYNGTEAFQQVFKSENGRGLGDTANDFEAYELDGVAYVIIAVDISSQLEIVNQTTLKSVAQIPLFDESGNAREPRHVIVRGSYAYCCNFDGTVALIDLRTYTVEKLIAVGANPDGMTYAAGRLYISNSGGLHYPVYDSTISVIDLTNNEVIETFETRINSTQIVADDDGDLYQVSNGNYGEIGPALLRIDPDSHAILEQIEAPISSLQLVDNWMYYFDGDHQAIKRFDTHTEIFDPTVFVDLSAYETFHGYLIDNENQKIYCVDANGYVNSSTIKVYDMNGNYLYSFQAGLVSKAIIITP